MLRRSVHVVARRLLQLLPRAWRFEVMRSMVACELDPGPSLELKIADTREELEACFALLHDAYVGEGFMKPDPSGLRVTAYHALPTTTTLCAKVDGRVVGTLSLIREGVFGFPMQTAFDLSAVRARQGRIAEVSALAVHRDFRRTGGRILFPLMKFMYEYCTSYFDTRHLLIAVNPNKIELYEALLGFKRLPAAVVDRYDFANGAPAVGAALDLARAPAWMQARYGRKAPGRDLHHYFVWHRLPHIQAPLRRYHTTNDPVMTEALIEHFFLHRTQAYKSLDTRRQLLLRTLYRLDRSGRGTSPELEPASFLRAHPRYSIACPARWRPDGGGTDMPVRVVDMSLSGCRLESAAALASGQRGRLTVELGQGECSVVEAAIVRKGPVHAGAPASYGFRVLTPDAAWTACVEALERGRTHADLMSRTPPSPAALELQAALAAAA
jgi:hypothetical protein